MRNLELLELQWQPVTSFPKSIRPSKFALTSDCGFFLNTSDNSLNKLEFNLTHAATDITQIHPGGQDLSNVVALVALSIERKIMAVLKQKCIKVFDIETELMTEIELVDGFEGNDNLISDIEAAAWSPTEEMAVVIGENGDVSTYTFNYDDGEAFVQGRSSVRAEIPGTVYVGWGSKETQFRGSAGKMKPEAGVGEKEELRTIEDTTPKVSWRGNGEMFVINYWHEGRRTFTVFELPCNALYRCSPEHENLLGVIAWRPAGNMIANVVFKVDEMEETGKMRQESTKRGKIIQMITVFEKNGEKRFDFPLPFLGDNAEIDSLKWSPCARALAIHSSTSDGTDVIHVMRPSNYHWFLKQSLEFKAGQLLAFDWLDASQFTLALRVVTSINVITYTFRDVITRSRDGKSCCVIDGCRAKLTDFSQTVVPPPIQSREIVCSLPILSAVFGDLAKLALVTCDGNIGIYNTETLELQRSIAKDGAGIEWYRFPHALHHVTWLPSQSEFCYVTETSCGRDLRLSCDASTGVNLEYDVVAHLIENEGELANHNFNKTDLSAVCVSDDSKNFEVVCGDGHYFQLSTSCRLSVDGIVVSDIVSSFIISGAYLLYTTKLNELICVRLSDIESLKSSQKDIYKRSVEQGATIVTAIPDSSQVVLQMPRGNLETISCRLIAIDLLDAMLEENQWAEALDFIRTEKLNANLLIDLNPNRFLVSVSGFVKAARSSAHFSNVCLEFEEGNILITTYPFWGPSEPLQRKLETVFGKLMEYFNEIEYAPYISAIVTINLHFFSLHSALVYVQDLYHRSQIDSSLTKAVTDAISTLKTYGCDQEQLYIECLLLYDLRLARMVASSCQMDPRIYEPDLENLRTLSEVELRFEINVRAKKYPIAQGYLLRSPKASSEQVREFIQKHNTELEAYQSCSFDSPYFKTVAKAFAEDLSRKKQFFSAAVIFKRSGFSIEALREITRADNYCDWQEAVNFILDHDCDDINKIRHYTALAEKLVAQRNFTGAAVVYENHVGSYEHALRVLIDNNCFLQAVHLMYKYKRPDYLVSDIAPALLKHVDQLSTKFHDHLHTFDRHRSRLIELRKSKTTRLQFPSEGGCDIGDSDLFSDAGSVVSKSSRASSSRSKSSTASSKNRRKEQRKKHDLREGGLYEDIAIIKALYEIIIETYSLRDDVETAVTLVLQEIIRSDSYAVARNLHDLYVSILTKIKKGVGEIWPEHFYLHNPTRDVAQIADLSNIEHLDLQYRTPPVCPAALVNWTLPFFKRIT